MINDDGGLPLLGFSVKKTRDGSYSVYQLDIISFQYVLLCLVWECQLMVNE